jgi:coenzyme F420-reducing hydrogenase alpha subunit
MPSKDSRSRSITVETLARVEGEASLRIEIRDGEVADLQLSIFEPPRFFEAFLRGRRADEAPDITARICGICPVAYQMSAVHALERAFEVEIDPAIRLLRRLLYCGEWIESHALHVHMLAAPDFLGCDSIVTLAERDRPAVERGLRLKRVGNAILELLGGRSVHPVGVCIGGFSRLPMRRDLATLRENLLVARDDARACLRWVAGFDLPVVEAETEFVALRHEQEYPFNEGDLVSSRGLRAKQVSFADHFEEYQAPHSNALFARRRGAGAYFVGPLARVNLNFDRLGEDVAAAARDTVIAWPSTNPFASIVARAIEIVYAVDEAIRCIDQYEPPAAPAAVWRPRRASGCAVTEAPRGILYHRYESDADGLLTAATIVPPTSQNQAQMEADLRRLAPRLIELSQTEATHLCETAIRNYDPCISCATHFLRLQIVRH